ncbi:transcription initiation factor TFIID subunit 12-like [Pyrus ussuriensis x Pyrus communis]|uniref:Transcription initiation factor TFIID subunit 12-like n=1 Tax=Pyrus ussuriensis x Pyrus communis TaxID=2448454 RepID=A0A5N5FXI7_9ROSA|nr:transcription initiation factor TFIID subunit 12-like [Pyrus ussuriensis x Pyrus communis]
MSYVEFMCRVPMLAPARMFSTLPHSPLCQPLAAVLLGTCSELPPGDWPLLLGCRLPLPYSCAQETSMKEMIGRVGELAGWQFLGPLVEKTMDASRMFFGFGLLGSFFVYVVFSFRLGPF